MSAEILHFFRVIDAPNRIRELRKLAGLSQQAVADAICVSKVTVSQLELGKMQLTHEYMRRIAPALGVTPADLLPRSDNPDGLTAEERDLIARLREADDTQRTQLRQLVDVVIPHPSNQDGTRKVA
ncbi:helix-turn-helix transcriptional regulator [uncultured Sphingopyxis sp.]|uniref:helix-turn-helix domain-containing protein n=1 Tax=uncultured Sphingopyxis sp. TaxID=310581 RepID=UPI00259AC38A|nr:helix-turn-helix transcriptional regulator [uncultured Sphingopyxis sp.]